METCGERGSGEGRSGHCLNSGGIDRGIVTDEDNSEDNNDNGGDNGGHRRFCIGMVESIPTLSGTVTDNHRYLIITH